MAKDGPQERLFALASSGREIELARLVTHLGYLQLCLALDGTQALLSSLKDLSARVQSGGPAHEAVEQVIEILRTEATSFMDWKPYEKGPALANQMVNASLRLGRPASSWRGLGAGETHHAGWLLRSWAAGRRDDWIRQVLPMPGDRSSYVWDIYDSGPAGCSTSMWIDLDGKRLLTETTSVYMAGMTDMYKTIRQVWDLNDGTLLERFDPVSYEGRSKDQYPPPAEFRCCGTRTPEPGPLPDDLAARVAPDVPVERISISPRARSLNSDEIIVSALVDRKLDALGHRRDEWLCVFDAKTDRVFRTDASLEGLKLVDAVRLQDGLTVFAVDHHEDVWRIRLEPREMSSNGELDPVVSVAIDPARQNLACLFTTRIEVRSASTGALLQSIPLEELGESAALETEHGRWSLVQEHSKRSLEGWPAQFSDGRWQYSAQAKPLPDRRETPMVSTAVRYEGRGHEFVTPTGRHVVLKRRCSIVVWEIPSGRWVGTLGDGPLYGGGGNLHGIAVSPDERHVISAQQHDKIGVWDLWDSRVRSWGAFASWKLEGLDEISGVAKLTFLWGGRLVAVATEDQMLYVCRFAQDSEVLAAIRLPQAPASLIGVPYGSCILAHDPTGTVTCYRYVPLPAADVTTIEGNTVGVRFRAPGASRVEIAGSFNGWTRSPLRHTSDGIWEERFSLDSGDHEYKLVVDDDRWELDPHVPSRPGPFGPNNYLDLPQDSRLSELLRKV